MKNSFNITFIWLPEFLMLRPVGPSFRRKDAQFLFHSAILFQALNFICSFLKILSHIIVNSFYTSLLKLPQNRLLKRPNVWNDENSSHVNKLYKLQKTAARTIAGSNYSIQSSDIFKRLRWDPVSKILEKWQLITMSKTIKGFVPSYLLELFDWRNDPRYSLSNNKIKYSSTQPN